MPARLRKGLGFPCEGAAETLQAEHASDGCTNLAHALGGDVLSGDDDPNFTVCVFLRIEAEAQ